MQGFDLITGFVLAGGTSRRMGKDKTKLVLAGKTMLERQVKLLCRVCRFVGVVGSSGNSSLDVSFLSDDVAGRGPLAGIYTGLRRTRTEFNLFLSCDLPFMEAAFLHVLCQRALASQADVTVPLSPSGGVEPLCAVYRRRALQAIRASLDAGENKVSRFFSRVRCEIIPWPEIANCGFAPRIFENMNTPEDYAAAKRALEKKSGSKSLRLSR